MDFGTKRAKLVEHLQAQIDNEQVLKAIKRVPRECFVPDELEDAAYKDSPLPIGYNQTISQPLIIALMAQALNLSGGEKILEVGTGSGYEAAILAEIAREVITTERIASLADTAGKALRSLGYTNIKIRLTGEKLGWEPEAPYDRIIVAAGAPQIPHTLMEQLKTGGTMVIPVGTRDVQKLYQITKLQDRNIVRELGGCRFVPLIDAEGWEER